MWILQMPCIANGRLREKRGLWEFSSTKCDFWELFGKLRVPECRQFWFWWNRLSWDCHYWAQHSDPSQSLILSNSKIYHLNLEWCLLRGLMRLKTKKTGNILRTLDIYVLVKCRAIMVERAPETGVDPLMKFSSQKNTSPPGAQSSTWRHKQSPKELGVLPDKFNTSIAKNPSFSADFEMVNNLPCQHEFSFAKQIQTSILDETIFGSVGGQVWQYFPPNIGIPVQWWSYTKGYWDIAVWYSMFSK